MLLSPLHRIARTVLIAALLTSLGGCAMFKRGPKYAGVDGDSVEGTPLPERQDGVSFMGDNVDKNRFAPIHFSFDSCSIDPLEAERLTEVSRFMRGGSKQLIIAGFTDERGTAEYNRGLGEKRAGAVRSWLLSHGADLRRIQTTSFGQEMPADAGHNEAAWAKNRRAEFGVTK